MHSRTRPLIPPRLATDLRSNRVKLDVSHRQPEMPIVIDKEHILAIITTLGDVSKTPGGDEHARPKLSLLISA